MQIINLRKFYPWYTHDELVAVPDAVAEAMAENQRLEAAQRRRVYRHKAQYSLDAGDGIENEVCFGNLSPHELYERLLLRCEVCKALNALPETQGRRVEAYYIRGISQIDIARVEGVAQSAVSASINRAIQSMKEFLEKNL